MKAKRKSFKARHKNIAKGKMSAAYWANKPNGDAAFLHQTYRILNAGFVESIRITIRRIMASFCTLWSLL